MTTLHDAVLDGLDARTLYQILALRSEVFVVEQNCAYLDPDGRDLEPGARQVWAEQDGAIVATLRLLHDSGGCARIGRVVTAPAARGKGVAAELMQYAIELAGPVEIVLDAQRHLAGWYGRFDFVRDGDDFVEDGIAHVPMRRGAG